jgi:hypothetical protein
MKLDAATRVVDKAEARERARAMAALRKWLPLRRAQLALVPLANADERATDADAVEAVFASWEKHELALAALEEPSK